MDQNLIDLIILQLHRSHVGCEIVVTNVLSIKGGFVFTYDRIPRADHRYDNKPEARLAFIKIAQNGIPYIPNDIITE